MNLSSRRHIIFGTKFLKRYKKKYCIWLGVWSYLIFKPLHNHRQYPFTITGNYVSQLPTTHENFVFVSFKKWSLKLGNAWYFFFFFWECGNAWYLIAQSVKGSLIWIYSFFFLFLFFLFFFKGWVQCSIHYIHWNLNACYM